MIGLIEACTDWARIRMPDFGKSFQLKKEIDTVVYQHPNEKYKGLAITFTPDLQSRNQEIAKQFSKAGYMHYFVSASSEFRVFAYAYYVRKFITADGTRYQVSLEKEKGSTKQYLQAECIESQTKTGSKFPIKEEDISRNLKFGSWKIES